jgi:hypothetical protein
VLGPGASRKRIAGALNAAYADGLLSEDTFVHRLDQLLAAPVVDPARFIGDLSFRHRLDWRTRLFDALAAVSVSLGLSRVPVAPHDEILLALDWTGSRDALVVGRHHACDVVLPESSVSRRHARLVFRDGTWVVQDLESTNGTIVNGVRVGRCALRPGDHLLLGEAHLRID